MFDNLLWKLHPHEKLTILKHTGYWQGAAAVGVSLALARHAPQLLASQLAARFLPAAAAAAAKPMPRLRTAWYLTSTVLSAALGLGVACRNTNVHALANDVARLPLRKDSAIADSFCDYAVQFLQDGNNNLHISQGHRSPEKMEKFATTFIHSCQTRTRAKEALKQLKREPTSTHWDDAVTSELEKTPLEGFVVPGLGSTLIFLPEGTSIEEYCKSLE